MSESAIPEARDVQRAIGGDGPASAALAIASYFLLALGIGALAATAYLVLEGYTPVPHWDEWNVIAAYLGQHPHLPLQWIWAQTNEHRIVPYKLLLLLNMHLFRNREWLMFLAIFLSQLSLFAALAILLRRIGRLEGWAYRAALGIALYCVFCPSQWENYTWGFQLSLVLVNLLFALALTTLSLLAQSDLPHNKMRLLLSISLLSAAAATISNANGVLAWPVLIAVSLMLRLRRSVTVAYVLFGTVLAGLYFYGYVRPSYHASPLASLRQPLQVVEYVEKYFGSSFVPDTHRDWSLHLGAVGLTLVFGLSFWIFRQLETREDVFSIGLLALMAFMFLTACITALGRINFGTDQAFAPRYQSYALLFWFAFAMLIMRFLMERGRSQAVAALLLVMVLLFAASSAWYAPILHLVRRRGAERATAAVALLTGVHDDDYFRATISSFPPIVWSDAAYFRQHGWSIFTTPQAREMEHPLRDFYELAPEDRCLGGIDRVQSFQATSGGLKLEGWAIEPQFKRGLEGAVMVNDGVISGYGVGGFRRVDIADDLNSRNARYSGWAGYVASGAKGITEVYAILGGPGRQKVCKIGQVSPPAE